MGTVVYLMNVSLDGFVETMDHSLDWSQVDEEVHRWFNDQMRATGAMVYGRRLWEVMAAFWPTGATDPASTPAMVEFAELWNATPHYVVSTSLARVEHGATLVSADPVSLVRRLRDEVEGQIGVGGPTLASAIIDAGLVDVFRVVVHPVILGAGLPYLRDVRRRLDLRLMETRRFGNGAVYLGYETRGEATAPTT